MWGTKWLWEYPAKQVGLFLVIIGIASIVFVIFFYNTGLGGWQNYYRLGSGLAELGTGAALLAYHYRKHGRW